MRNQNRTIATSPAARGGAWRAISASVRGTVVLTLLGVGPLGVGWPVLGQSGARAAEPTTITQGGITLKSVSVTLPDSETAFPGGDAAQVMVQNCTACHSPGMIMTQPALGEATWREEVAKMINVYKAPVSAEDVPAIVAYLTTRKGTR